MTAQFDIFLSHNGQDKDVVIPFAQALVAAGLSPWLDSWCLIPGSDWQSELAAALQTCRACAVCIGPHGLGAWTGLETRLALDRAAKDPSFRLFPVLLPGLAASFDPAGLPPFLQVYTWVDLRAGLDAPGVLAHIITAVRGRDAAPLSVSSAPAPAVAAPATVHALPALPDTLPAEVSSFVGRTHEQAAVAALMERARLVTLVGPGGIGKTRLALQVAATQRGRFPDGVWLVELAPLAEPGLVVSTVAGILGVREEAERPLLEVLTTHLRERALLLVLDNCEHVIAACAALVSTPLRACPHVCVLATSREGLEAPGEQLYRVPSLAVPDPVRRTDPEELAQVEAVQLFVARAQARRPDFRITEHNAVAVAAICRRLDGIPLALELAAARVSALPVEGIAARLDDRFRLLTGGPRTVLPRQQTLRAALDWSHDLLTAAEQVMLRRLAVFAGGWTLEAAEAVCAGRGVEDWEILDLLAGLVNKSLAQEEHVDGEARYGLLETVRQYGQEKLTHSGEAEVVQTRHLAWSLALAEQAEPHLRGSEQAVWLARLEREHDNLRAALRWARDSATDPTAGGEAELRLVATLWRFWEVRGHLGEGREWLEDALGRTPEAAPAVRARALGGAGNLAWAQGDYGRAQELHQESLALYRKVDDRRGVAVALNNLGLVAWNRGDHGRAQTLYEESLALLRELDDRWGIAMALTNLGLVVQDQGDAARAQALHEESLTLYRASGDTQGVAASLGNLGYLAFEQGDAARALALLKESLTLYQGLGGTAEIADCLESLADVAATQGQAVRAARLLGASETLRSALAAPLRPVDQAAFERTVAAVRLILGPEITAAAWAEGRALSLDQVIAEALNDTAR